VNRILLAAVLLLAGAPPTETFPSDRSVEVR
jgi:hypothetical protein